MRHSPTLALLGLLCACRTGRDYSDAREPRYAGRPTAAHAARPLPDTLRVVTFNIAFARQIDSALALLGGEAHLRDADILTLQEMDADATRRIADSLGMWYVYYPAIFHNRTKRDFGNAVLSRWPIIDDSKIVLPHPSRYAGTHRTATAASVAVGPDTIRVYSTHLGTVADISSSSRHAQLRAILENAERYRRVIVAGDLNEGDIGSVATEQGYRWPTREGPRTTSLGRWDHVFVRGFVVDSATPTGTIRDARGASDHKPVWLRLPLTPRP